MALAPGTRLGPYEIAGPLGAGGMGEVYKARDTRLDRTVAIKILPSGDPDRRERFAREAKAIAALSHPNICVLHDVGQESGIEFIVIEYLEGETLADRLKEGPLPPETLLKLATEIADALESAHAATIVHRDLKPANIFITRRGQTKVLDFGLAKLARRRGEAADLTNLPTMHADRQLTGAGSTLGTVAYMSPEQARGEDTDERSDVFSFGAMLYEMATGQPAFPGRTTAVVFDEILNRTPVAATKVNATVPVGLEAVIERALEKDRERRYQTAAELHKDLDALHRGAPPVTPRAASGSRPAARRLGALAAGAVVVLGLLAWWFGAGRPAGGPIDSIAVLPFVNASGNADADYLSQGIADTLTNNLTQIKGLRVVPRTLAAKYRNVAVDPREAGRDLNARAIVTGRVVQRGDRLTIQAELIDAVSVAQLWGDQFDRSLADVLSVQADISRAIADNLRRRLTREDEVGLTASVPRDPVAYQLYLRARHATLKRTREGYGQATQYLRQAIARDHAYAQAYAGLADAYVWQAYWGYLPSAETYGQAVEAARKALAIDDRSAEAHAALGWLHLYKDWNWGESEQAYQRALALDPTSADIHALYGESLGTKRRFDEAIAEVRKGAALDPLSSRITVSLGFLLTNAGRYDEAIQMLKQAAELDPDFTLPRLDLARAYRLAGMADLAIAESRRMLGSGDPLGPTFLAAAYGRAGRKGEAMPLLREMIAKARRSPGESFKIALVYASMSERDSAFEWLEKAFAEHDTFLPWLNSDPDFDPLRSDPRFDALIRRIGIPLR
jgi:TolB-like protein/Tfp pilus assembly protein PilF